MHEKALLNLENQSKQDCVCKEEKQNRMFYLTNPDKHS